jgi:hypothetical protein
MHPLLSFTCGFVLSYLQPTYLGEGVSGKQKVPKRGSLACRKIARPKRSFEMESRPESVRTLFAMACAHIETFPWEMYAPSHGVALRIQ